MIKFLDKPCLPENRVVLVLISSEYKTYSDILSDKFDISSIYVNKNELLTDDISAHADCIFTQIDRKTAIIDKSQYENIVNKLTIGDIENSINYIKSNYTIKSPYPEDVRLNVRIISDQILCNTKYIDNNLRDYAKMNQLQMIHCNQGYVACSTIIINDHALITDDESILHSAQLNGIDCIYVRKGSVKLKGRDYGFIGGTCGMIDKNLIAFTGKLDSHIDCNIIKSFLNKYNVNYIELTEEPLIDIGGIIPILEHSTKK